MGACFNTISIAIVFFLCLLVTTQMTSATSFSAQKSFNAKKSFSFDATAEKEINNELVVNCCKNVTYKGTCYKTYKSSEKTVNATDMNKVVAISIGCILDHGIMIEKSQKITNMFKMTKAFMYKKAYNAIILKLKAIKKAKEFKRKKMIAILNFVIEKIKFCKNFSLSVEFQKKVFINEEHTFMSENEEMLEMSTNTVEMCRSLPE